MQAGADRAPSTGSARDLAAATPDSRNRYADLIRVVAIGCVIIGHWMMAVLGYRDGSFTGANLLELDPSLHIITWVFQVMPLFFIVGGFTNAMSWSSARARGDGYGMWLRARSVRLIRPAIWFVAFWTLLPVAGVALGILPSSVAKVGSEEVALPMWFLAVYLVVVAAAPLVFEAHRRFGGTRVVIALTVGIVVVDNIHFGLDVGWVGAGNFAFVWLGMLELGVLWREGALRARPWIPWVMAGGGLAALAVMTLYLDFPVSMVGLTHGVRSNTMPPTGALAALGVWQCGAMLLFEDAANRWLQRPRAWLSVIVANSVVMTCYLWNMSAVVLAAVLLFPTGIAPQPEELSTTWWVLRPAWLLACAICLTPFVFAFRWAERPVSVTGRVPTSLVVAGTVFAAGGFAALAARAFPVPGQNWTLPAAAVAAVALGSLLVRVDPFAPLRRGAPH